MQTRVPPEWLGQTAQRTMAEEQQRSANKGDGLNAQRVVSPLEAAVNDLHNAVDQAESLLSQLRDRMAPLLVPETEGRAEPVGPPTAARPPLILQLEALRHRVDSLSVRLRSIHERAAL